jgi:glycerol-3-phosphate dehydrogenase (NAD(P)+)
MSHVAVIGGGSWGTALARQLALKGTPVRLWVREPDLAAAMRETRRNEIYLPGFDLPPGLAISSELGEVCPGSAWAILAVPTRHCRNTLMEARGLLEHRPRLVVASKGIEQESLLRGSGIVADLLGAGAEERTAVLSGPSFASEVASGRPTAVVAASREEALASQVQELLSDSAFRIYTSADPVGVEMGGALKNVVAIAAGVIAGLDLGPNTLAALVTRGLAEISRLAVALGGRRETLAGLAGLGDLVLTCTGSLSRNRQVGFALGQGKSLEKILGGMTMVAEGVDTARSAKDLGDREGVSMPITGKVNQVLFQGKAPEEGIRELLNRPPRPERD